MRTLFAAVVLVITCAAPTVPSVAPPSVDTTPASRTAAATTAPATSAPAQGSPTAAADGLVFDQARVERYLDALAQIAAANGGIRAAGTSGYAASVDFVVGELEALGLTVRRQPFEFTFFDEAAPVELTVGDQSWTGGEWLHSMLYGGEGNVGGVLEEVGRTNTNTTGCQADEWDDFTAGHIAVVPGGGCFYRDKLLNAQNAGALAVIAPYVAWGSGQTRRPTLIDPGVITIPAIVVGQEPALALFAAAEAGESARLVVDTVSQQMSIDNVIAELPGATADVIMLGGHLDSVLDGPGINDNGSGVSTVLAIAAAGSSQAIPHKTLRFAFWAAEEYGELGSTHYVDSLSAAERDQIDAYFNLDMVGSVAGEATVYDDVIAAVGSSGLTDALVAALQDLGRFPTPTDLGGASDHAQFERVGIVTGGVFSGVDDCYHLACDGRDNVDVSLLMDLGDAIATVVEDLAY
ncbi:MAG: M20/M25/M40 family metallo-hydrolase [Candidatus Limnocylindrales bacterium]